MRRVLRTARLQMYMDCVWQCSYGRPTHPLTLAGPYRHGGGVRRHEGDCRCGVDAAVFAGQLRANRPGSGDDEGFGGTDLGLELSYEVGPLGQRLLRFRAHKLDSEAGAHRKCIVRQADGAVARCYLQQTIRAGHV